MGRAHEVRAAAMAKTAAAKSKLYSRYGKELLIAAKAGVPDPEMNLGLKRKIAEAKAIRYLPTSLKERLKKRRAALAKTTIPAVTKVSARARRQSLSTV